MTSRAARWALRPRVLLTCNAAALAYNVWAYAAWGWWWSLAVVPFSLLAMYAVGPVRAHVVGHERLAGRLLVVAWHGERRSRLVAAWRWGAVCGVTDDDGVLHVRGAPPLRR